jgi:hypothetical protein
LELRLPAACPGRCHVLLHKASARTFLGGCRLALGVAHASSGGLLMSHLGGLNCRRGCLAGLCCLRSMRPIFFALRGRTRLVDLR